MVDIEQNIVPTKMSSSCNLMTDSPKKRFEGSWKEEICSHTAFGLETTVPILPWVSSLPACPEDFRLNSHNCVNQFLKIGTHFSLSLFSLSCIYTYILFILFLWIIWLLQHVSSLLCFSFVIRSNFFSNCIYTEINTMCRNMCICVYL